MAKTLAYWFSIDFSWIHCHLAHFALFIVFTKQTPSYSLHRQINKEKMDHHLGMSGA